MIELKPLTLTGFFNHEVEPLNSVLNWDNSYGPTNILFITHAECMDGVLSEAIFSTIMENFACDFEVLRTKYGITQTEAIMQAFSTATEAGRPFDMVIMADMSVSERHTLLETFKGVKWIYMFDHHPNSNFTADITPEGTQLNFCGCPINHGINKPTVNLIIQDHLCGGALLYRYAVDNNMLTTEQKETLYPLMRVINDYDTHTHSMPETRNIVGMLYGHFSKHNDINALIELMKPVSKPTHPAYIAFNDAMKEFEKTTVASQDLMCGRVFELSQVHSIKLDDDEIIKFVMVRADYANRSPLYRHFELHLARDYPNHALVIFDDISQNISVRSVEGGLAKKLATQFHGGGHDNASGIPFENARAFLNAFQ